MTSSTDGPAGTGGASWQGASTGGATPDEEHPEGSGGRSSEGAASGGSPDQQSEDDCPGGEVLAAKRMIRLSLDQLANSIASLFDATLGTQLSEHLELAGHERRAFLPLASPNEGTAYTKESWELMDQIAQTAGQYVNDNFSRVTQCGDEPSDACALLYLTSLAEKAYRRPMTEEERDRLSALYENSFRGEGASIVESVQFGVYFIFQSPHFLYRTEFGENSQANGPLSQLELASMLSYFLTDDTPDEELHEAAVQGELATSDEVGEQVDRILESEIARTNLHGAMMNYFAFSRLESLVIQDKEFSAEMRVSMVREAGLFLERVLWSQPLEELLLSRTSFVDARLASLYGISPFPPADSTPLDETFYEVQLPENRTGILTQPGFLSTMSRPEQTSVVLRGLLVRNLFLCTQSPPPPDGVEDAFDLLPELPRDATEREWAEARAAIPTCDKCHGSFDAYGLALQPYDLLGRYREVDEQGRPIDPSVMLPQEIGGGQASNILEVAAQFSESGAFSRCMAKSLLDYALAEKDSASVDSCTVKRVIDDFEASDESFSALVRAVAVSEALTERREGDM